MSGLAPEVAERYSAIIDDILENADLNTISAKRIRKGLQERLGQDISGEKQAVTDLIMVRFDKFNAEQNGAPEPEEPVPSVEAPTNGHTTGKRTPDDDSALSELDESPPKKKPRKHKSTEDEDAAYAARLQAEENMASRARSTRGGNTKKKAAPQKKTQKKKKSANKVKDEDDSDIASGSGGEKKSPKRTGGFHKPMNLSTALQDLLGETQLSRPQTVKKIWEYVKARDLQDPADKRQIRCDDAMRAVFKQDSVHMFTMNKILNTNLYPVED
ncbi:SWIB-domain-containing protein [Bimuria novae-zelandiae CBS 107.79]|uniref:SWIB-domain-containing protein n=1 Tax=Bimuria novae-zelandiae CBS 107.79 TaxID=1447943 RepID=A0A6A5UXJ5_9PLEO|nr:SWIB-domain-containing protein [Bimuria novae-zelandiae CBS 107.79]